MKSICVHVCTHPIVIKAGASAAILLAVLAVGRGQMVDKTLAPNAANSGINKSYLLQTGPGRGDWSTPDSSSYVISRDPFRSIRRGRMIFQRKFTRLSGLGPAFGDGSGDVGLKNEIGAGLADSCAACHGRPKGAAGFGGDVVTRPDSRDAPHLFGLGLKEMLADEITSELRATRTMAQQVAKQMGRQVTQELSSKGISFGTISARPDGTFDTSKVQGIDPDLRVKPFFAHGGTTSIREFINGAFKNEMGLESTDPDTFAAANGGRVVTPSGMVLDGSLDKIEAPQSGVPADGDRDGVMNEIPTSIVDHMEFYLMNYFKPGTYQETIETRMGQRVFERIGCAGCHVGNLMINSDRRVADVETVYDPRGAFNSLFATATPLYKTTKDGSYPDLKQAALRPFLVKNIFTDFKRHDLGPNFWEYNFDGTWRKEFITTPLWGVGSTPPYGHDGRSINLPEVILRHGGEAEGTRDNFARLEREERNALVAFLETLIIFPPDDTASNLDPGGRSGTNYPQQGHGSLKLSVLFNDPNDLE